MRRLVLGAALAVAGVGVAGCGGSSDSGFKKDFTADRVELKSIGSALGTTVQNAGHKTDAELSTELSDLANRMAALSSKLAALKPPAKVQSDFASLKGALATGEQDLRGLSAAVGAHNAAAARTGTQKLLGDSPAVKTSDDAIAAKEGIK